MVAMVGDGGKDAGVRGRADLGLPRTTSTKVAREAGDLTTNEGDLLWAFADDGGARPLTTAGLLRPMLASAAVPLSAVWVVTRNFRLRIVRPLERSRGAATCSDVDDVLVLLPEVAPS